MSRRSTAPKTQSVDALLPCLGGLSVNGCASRHVVEDEIDIEAELENILGELDSIEAKRGRDWFVENDSEEAELGDGVEDDGSAKKMKFDDKLHKSILLEENRTWMKYYPPTVVMPDTEYDYKNWTSFYPQGKGNAVINVKNPHWKHPDFESMRHATLKEARIQYGAKMSNLVDTSKKSPEEKSETSQAVDEFVAILTEDGDVKQYSGTKEEQQAGKEQLSNSLEKLLDMLRAPKAGIKQPLWPRKKEENKDLPPGWISLTKYRSPKTAEDAMANGKLGQWKYGDKQFIGPVWELWGSEDEQGMHEARKCTTIKDAWLIYTGYQKSSKTNDPNAKTTDNNQKRTKSVQDARNNQGGPSADGGPSGMDIVDSDEEDFL